MSSPRFRILLQCIVIACLATAHAAETEHSDGGIWKAVVPPHTMHGEFDNFDPMGLGAGAQILADCSLNWVNPDDGKLYCFASGTSLVYFLERPNTNIRNAEAAWISLHPPK